MSAEAVGWVWKHSPMEKSVLLVHLAVADVTNDLHGNQLWCSTDTLRQKTRLSRRAVMIALDQLVLAGLLIENERPGRTTLYRFEMPPLPEQNLPPLADGGEQDLRPGGQDSATTPAESAPELNRIQANNLAPISQKRDPDPSCIQCQGRGVKGYALVGEKMDRTADVPCDCTLEDYEPRPEAGTPPEWVRSFSAKERKGST